MEESVKLRFYLAFLLISLFLLASAASAQVDSLVGQFTNSSSPSFAGSISGNGRFVVFESRGDLATENPRNADGNLEIFLWDYAQRRIFQITDTKDLLFNPSAAATTDNIRVEIMNTHPVISNDGKWIAFSSNATIAYPGDATNPPIISSTNPGSFDANSFTAPTPTPSPSPSPSPSPGANSLTNDGNLEVWLYQIPAYADVPDLSAGDEIPFTNLAPFNTDGSTTGGTFTSITNTVPSQLPRAGSTLTTPFIAADNHDPSIDDDGGVIAFVSTRDLITGGNPFPTDDNDEIFTFARGPGMFAQITKTGRGTISSPIYNKNVTISGAGTRVVFASTGENPVFNGSSSNLDCGSTNPASSRNEEIFYADLTAGLTPSACKQITTTTPTSAGGVVNILDLGRRMSRDGRYIAFDSYADLKGENGGTNYTSFATYLYDTTILPTPPTAPYSRIGPRSDADSAATGGDVQRYPGFTTDPVDNSGVLVLETRLNIKADGTIPATASDGLNPDAARPPQIYRVPLTGTVTFTRLTKLPAPVSLLPSTQPLTSNSITRIAFNLAFTEVGTGNSDFGSEAYYLLTPSIAQEQNATFSFATGASRLSVNPSPTPTPSPTATPTATPTPTPSPTPTGSPSPTPTPTPVTPSAVLGLSPGMLAVVQVTPPSAGAITARTAVGSLQRSFTLPIELSHFTVSINGVACGLKSVSRLVNRYEIIFVVPRGLPADSAGTSYPMVIINNGTVYRSNITIVPARPDIFTTTGAGPGGRAKLFNVTNRVPTTEPFAVFTVMLRGGKRVPSKMRLYLTGVEGITSGNFVIRIGPSTVTSVTTGAVLVEPGVYTVDFAMPTNLVGAGDQPIVVTININGVSFSSRLDDTAPRLSIL
jgi:hypothetical protein